MKKLISMVIATIMVVSLIPIGMVNATETETETGSALTKLLDMTISASDDDATLPVVSDEAGESSLFKATTYGWKAIDGDANKYQTNTDIRPALNYTYNGTPYLTFAELNAAGDAIENVDRTVNIELNTEQKNPILNKDSLTFEMWVRDKGVKNNSTYRGFFGIGNHRAFAGQDNHGRMGFSAQLNMGSGSNFTRSDGGIRINLAHTTPSLTASTNTSTTGLLGKMVFVNGNIVDEPTDDTSRKLMTPYAESGAWHHIVITREWAQTTAATYDTDGWITAAATGKWTIKYIVDGVVKSTFTNSTDVDRVDYGYVYPSAENGSPHNYNRIIIGRSDRANNAIADSTFMGDIGDFAVYEGAMTEAEASANYLATRSNYIPIAPADTIFEMDLSDCAVGEALDVRNRYIYNNDMSEPANPDTYYPYGVNAGSNAADESTQAPLFQIEDGVKYLRFAYKDADGVWQNKSSQLNISLKNQDFMDNQAMTVEAWARNNSVSSEDISANVGEERYFFSLGANPNLTREPTDAFKVNISKASGSYNTMVVTSDVTKNKQGATASIADTEGEWTHYVITRKWTKSDSATTDFDSGKWTTNIYINGVLAGTQTDEDADSRTDYNTAWWDADKSAVKSWVNNLAIGGNSRIYGKERAFTGDIAAFNLYSVEWDAAKVMEAFDSSVDNYNSGLYGDSFVNQDGIALTSSNIAAATKVEVKNAKITGYTADAAPFAILGVYKDGELVKAIKLNAEIDAENDIATISGAVDGITAASIDDVKMFIWESPENIRPLYPVSCL